MEPGCQMVFVDTPGYAPARNLLGEMMAGGAVASAREADLIVYVIDSADPEPGDGMKRLLGRQEQPKILALNKIDLVAKDALLPLIDKFSKQDIFREIVPISAIKEDGTDRLLGIIRAVLPPGPSWYGSQTEAMPDSWLIQEIVQEKIFRLLHKEVPYGCGVLVQDIEREGQIIRIRANILVERDSHRPIVIGEKARTLKKIGTDSRLELEKLLGSKVHLELWVKVDQEWRDRESRLSELGYAHPGTVPRPGKRGKIP